VADDAWTAALAALRRALRPGGRLAFGLREPLPLRATGEHVVSPTRLRFRTQEEVSASLDEAGFTVERVLGHWDGRPPGPGTEELIVVAVR
jgi:hypothetical protein